MKEAAAEAAHAAAAASAAARPGAAGEIGHDAAAAADSASAPPAHSLSKAAASDDGTSHNGADGEAGAAHEADAAATSMHTNVAAAAAASNPSGPGSSRNKHAMTDRDLSPTDPEQPHEEREAPHDEEAAAAAAAGEAEGSSDADSEPESHAAAAAAPAPTAAASSGAAVRSSGGGGISLADQPAPVPSTVLSADGRLIRRRRKRRKVLDISSDEVWTCSVSGCGKQYKKTSTVSITAHNQRNHAALTVREQQQRLRQQAAMMAAQQEQSMAMAAAASMLYQQAHASMLPGGGAGAGAGAGFSVPSPLHGSLVVSNPHAGMVVAPTAIAAAAPTATFVRQASASSATATPQTTSTPSSVTTSAASSPGLSLTRSLSSTSGLSLTSTPSPHSPSTASFPYSQSFGSGGPNPLSALASPPRSVSALGQQFATGATLTPAPHVGSAISTAAGTGAVGATAQPWLPGQHASSQHHRFRSSGGQAFAGLPPLSPSHSTRPLRAGVASQRTVLTNPANRHVRSFSTGTMDQLPASMPSGQSAGPAMAAASAAPMTAELYIQQQQQQQQQTSTHPPLRISEPPSTLGSAVFGWPSDSSYMGSSSTEAQQHQLDAIQQQQQLQQHQHHLLLLHQMQQTPFSSHDATQASVAAGVVAGAPASTPSPSLQSPSPSLSTHALAPSVVHDGSIKPYPFPIPMSPPMHAFYATQTSAYAPASVPSPVQSPNLPLNYIPAPPAPAYLVTPLPHYGVGQLSASTSFVLQATGNGGGAAAAGGGGSNDGAGGGASSSWGHFQIPPGWSVVQALPCTPAIMQHTQLNAQEQHMQQQQQQQQHQQQQQQQQFQYALRPGAPYGYAAPMLSPHQYSPPLQWSPSPLLSPSPQPPPSGSYHLLPGHASQYRSAPMQHSPLQHMHALTTQTVPSTNSSQSYPPSSPLSPHTVAAISRAADQMHAAVNAPQYAQSHVFSPPSQHTPHGSQQQQLFSPQPSSALLAYAQQSQPPPQHPEVPPLPLAVSLPASTAVSEHAAHEGAALLLVSAAAAHASPSSSEVSSPDRPPVKTERMDTETQ